MNLKDKPFNLTDSEEKWVNDVLNSLTTKEKIGQLFIILGDLYQDDTLDEFIKEYAIGGILFRPDLKVNIQSKYEHLDKISKVPLIKAANLEEGGNGAIEDGTRFSTELGVSATRNPKFAYELGLVSGKEAKEACVNASFSPDTDIDYNYLNPITNERTFGSDPKLVKEMSLSFYKGLSDSGIIAFAKHFPGDGTDFRDQHLLPSYNLLTSRDWFNSYGEVYKALIDNGIPGIMVGHITSYNLEKEFNPNVLFKDALPASLSDTLLNKLLREKLGFNGLIVTDATIMGGFDSVMERRLAIPYAIKSGIDMLVFNLDLKEDMSYIDEALNNKTLSYERLDEAVKRILGIKVLIKRKENIKVNVDTKSWQEDLIDNSITLVKNNDNILPITKEKYPRIELRILGNDKMTNGSLKDTAKEYLEKEGFEVSVFDIEKEELRGTKNLDKGKLILYLANLETASNQTSVRINWAKKHALDSPRFINEIDYVFISFANPYHLIDVPRIKTYINSYTLNKEVVEASLKKILKKPKFKGISPVDPFCGLMDTHL